MSSDRFHIVESTQMALPHKCLSCGGGDNSRKYIDTGLDVDYYGVVYFCTLCFESLAEKVNYSPTYEKIALEDTTERQLVTIINLNKQNEAIKHAMAVLLAPSTFPLGNPSNLVDRLVSGFQASLEADREASRNDSGPDESSVVEGSSDVLPVADDSVSKPAAKPKSTK